MSPSFQNVKTGTQPLIAHHPALGIHGFNRAWSLLDPLLSQVGPAPDDTTLSFWSNRTHPSRLELQYVKAGLPYLVLGGPRRPWKNWLSKLVWLAEAKVETKYLLVTDADDVKLIGPLARLPELFQQESEARGGGLKALFNGERRQWPVDGARQRKWGDEIDSPWRYLNAGVAFGESRFLIDLAQRVLSWPPGGNFPEDDQYLLQTAWSEDPVSIGVDYRCTLFQVLYGKGAWGSSTYRLVPGKTSLF